MKLLPWIIAAVVLGVLQTALKYCGITLGGLPTIFLFVIVWFVSKKLLEKYKK